MNIFSTQGKRIYVSVQGDLWDIIAIRVYGFKRGNESLMYRLLEENYTLRDVSVFPAGIAVFVPEVAVATEIPLVPWKSTTVIP
jgi:phage tail protein X